MLARAARQLVEGTIQTRAPQAFVCYLLGSDWSHATLAVTVLPLPIAHRSLHGMRCRPHTLITRCAPLLRWWMELCTASLQLHADRSGELRQAEGKPKRRHLS
jgi:hypothetical protein